MDTDKAKGIIYGLAIGDALGYPTEFLSLPQIKEKYGSLGIQDLSKAPALFSDDTQMSIAITEALIRVGDKNIETIMEAVKDEFIKWYHSPENNRAPGRTCLIGVENMERGQHWSKSGVACSLLTGIRLLSLLRGHYRRCFPRAADSACGRTSFCCA